LQWQFELRGVLAAAAAVAAVSAVSIVNLHALQVAAAADEAESEDGDEDTKADGPSAPGGKGAAAAGSFTKPEQKARAGQTKRSTAAAFAAGKPAPRSAPASRFNSSKRAGRQQRQRRVLGTRRRQGCLLRMQVAGWCLWRAEARSGCEMQPIM
jgi:hypothetical protein